MFNKDTYGITRLGVGNETWLTGSLNSSKYRNRNSVKGSCTFNSKRSAVTSVQDFCR